MRTRLIAIVVLGLLTLPSVLSLSLFADHGSREIDPWVIDVVGLERQAIHDMAVGEVDATSPGLEVILTGGGGIISQYSSETFQQRSIYTLLKTQQAIDIGDIDSRSTGNEIVSVGQDKKVNVIYHEDDGSWNGKAVLNSLGSLNGVTIGEFNQSHPGLEIAAVGDEAMLYVINEDPTVTGGWASMAMQVNTIPITNMMAASYDLDVDSPGDEILIGSFSGHAYMVKHDAQGKWNISTIWRDDFAILGFGYGANIVPNITTPEIYVASFSGKVELVYHNGTNWTNETVYQDKEPMYIVEPADVDPRYPGAELVTCGIGRNVHIIRYDNGSWVRETIVDRSTDSLNLLYDIKIAEVDSNHPGLEILVGGIHQQLIEITYFEPGFELEPLPASQTVVSGQDADFWIRVDRVGNFEGEVTLSSTAEVTFRPSKASPGDLVHAVVHTTPQDTAGKSIVGVSGVSGTFEAKTELELDVLSKDSSGIGLELFPDSQTVTPGFSTTFMIQPTIIGDWYPYMQFSVDNPGGNAISVTYDPLTFIEPALITVSAPILARSATHHLVIRCNGTDPMGGYFESVVVATLVVDANGVPDFTISVNPTNAVAATHSSVTFELVLNPLFGFDEDVVLSVDGLPENSTGSFSANVVSLPAKVLFKLDVGYVYYFNIHVLTFEGSGGGLVRKAVSSLFHAGVDPSSADHFPTVIPSTQVASPGQTIQYLVYISGYGEIKDFEVDNQGGPFQGTITPGKDGNSEYRLMTIKVNKDAVPGSYEGQALVRGLWERNASFEVLIDPTKDLDIALEKDTIECVTGSSYCDGGGFNITGIEGPAGRVVSISRVGIFHTSINTNIRWNDELDGVLVPIRKDELRTTNRGKEFHVLLMVSGNQEGSIKALVGTISMLDPMPILGIEEINIEGIPREGSTMEIDVHVTNIGSTAANDVTIEFLMDGKLIGEKTIDEISNDPKGSSISLEWEAVAGEHNLTVLIADAGDGQTFMTEDEGFLNMGVNVNQISFEGPAIALLLILAFVGLSIVMRSKTERE